MALSMDRAERQVRQYTCGCCHKPIDRTWNFVRRDGIPHAVYFANCYHHSDQPHDTWIDVIIGTWSGDTAEDHVTFACRVGPVQNSDQPAATLVQACTDGSGGEVHGRILSREDALTHPRLPEFWEIVDLVLEDDPTINAHLYG